jgi:hypothetical protein
MVGEQRGPEEDEVMGPGHRQAEFFEQRLQVFLGGLLAEEAHVVM